MGSRRPQSTCMGRRRRCVGVGAGRGIRSCTKVHHCERAIPADTPAHRFKVRVFNHVMSSRHTTMDLTGALHTEEVEGLGEPYHLGYYRDAQTQNWYTNPVPLDEHQQTILTRRQAVVSPHLPGAAQQMCKRRLDDVDIQREIQKRNERYRRRKARIMLKHRPSRTV
jgi:hypothetical protein